MSLLGHDKTAVKSWEAASDDVGLEVTVEDNQARLPSHSVTQLADTFVIFTPVTSAK